MREFESIGRCGVSGRISFTFRCWQLTTCTGTVRVYLQNHITGVSEDHNAILRLVGVGCRATIENTATTVQSESEGQRFVNLKV